MEETPPPPPPPSTSKMGCRWQSTIVTPMRSPFQEHGPIYKQCSTLSVAADFTDLPPCAPPRSRATSSALTRSMFANNERPERIRTTMGMGDNEKRCRLSTINPHHPFSLIDDERSPTSQIETAPPQFIVVKVPLQPPNNARSESVPIPPSPPSQMEPPLELFSPLWSPTPQMGESPPMEVQSVPPPPQPLISIRHDLSPPRSMCNKTAPDASSRVDSERRNRKFLADRIKQRRSEQMEKKATADRYLQRMAKCSSHPRSQICENKSTRQQPRSATFVVDNPIVCKGPEHVRGDQPPTPRFSVDSLRTPKPDIDRSQPKSSVKGGAVVLNKAARLRLERFAKK